MNDVHIPLREYLEEKDENLRRWMAATFATKDDLGLLRLDVTALNRDARESRKVAATWAGAGTTVGAALVMVLSYFGVKPQQ